MKTLLTKTIISCKDGNALLIKDRNKGSSNFLLEKGGNSLWITLFQNFPGENSNSQDNGKY